MKCPFLRAGNIAALQGETPDDKWTGDNCMLHNCGLWNEHFGKCSFSVDAYLKGHEDARKESQIDARD